MIIFSLISLVLVILLLIPVFGYRKGSRSLKITLLVVADVFMMLSHYLALSETEVADSALYNYDHLLSYLIFITLNVLAIYKIFSKISPDQDLYDKWHKDPANWKAGIFYYNPEDKRMFPPKRISGMGWTINFANPYSLLAYALMFLIVFAVIRYFGF